MTDWLGLGQRMVQPWSEDEPRPARARPSWPSGWRTPPTAPSRRWSATGLIERRADTVPVVYFVASPGLLDVALQLVALGIDVETAAALRDLLQTRMRDLAAELVAEFTDRVSLSHLADAGPAALSELLAALQPVTRRSVELAFAHEMERAQRALLDAAIAAAQPPEEPS